MDACGHKIIVAGIGPGADEYILPAALAAIKKARVLVGGRRALSHFAANEQRTMAVTRDIDGLMDFIRGELERDDVTVMVSGDPGYYSLLFALRKEFSAEQIETIPGISSLQFAFSRISLPWQDAKFVSLHGRTVDESELLPREKKILGMLTDDKNNSRTVSRLLLRLGWRPDAELFVCERLSYADEKITRTTLSAAAEAAEIKHCVLIAVG